jgi:hypothetical protein
MRRESTLGYNLSGMLKYLAGIVLVFGLAVYISVQDKSGPPTGHTEADHPDKDALPAKPDEDHSQQNMSKTERNPPRWYRFFSWGDGTTTWVIVLTLLAIAEQTNETRRATDSQREKDRARLLAEISHYPANTDLNSISDPVDFYWSLGLKITQQGPTKAFNVVGLGTVLVRPSSEKRPTLPGKQMQRIGDLPSIVQDAAGAIEAVVYFRGIPDEDLRLINAEEFCAHFFGEIHYQDVFGAPHKTTFRYIWKPEIREPVPGVEGETFVVEEAGWEISGNPKDNRAT